LILKREVYLKEETFYFIWHAIGADVFNTIYAKSEVPLLSGFTSIFAIIALVMMLMYIGLTRKK
jgi:hypothetical protein